MQCQQVHEHLSAYVDRELTSELSAAVRAHLDACAECRALADDLRATADLLGQLPVQAAPKHLAEDIQREIERRTILPKGGAEQQPQERSLPIARVRRGPRALAVAAAVVLAAGIGLFTYLGHTRPAAPDKRVAMQTRPSPAPALRPEGKGPGARPAKEAAPAATADHDAKTEVAKAPAPVAAPSVSGVGGGAALRDRGASSIEAKEKYEVARSPAATPRPAEKSAAGEPMSNAPASVAAGKAADDVYDKALATDTAQKRSGHAAAPAVAEGPDAVQLTMNQVANGEARVDQLQAVATSRNLRRADNQLVVRARSVDEANGELFRLFEANGWRPVTLAADEGYYRATGAPMKPFGKDAGKPKADVPAAPGIYYLASRGAETTWVVVTDRDNLSRFGGQLAQASGITISAGSSGDLARAVGQLQSELREQAVAQKSRPAEPDARAKAARRGQTEVAAKPAAPSQSASLWAAAPAEAAPPAAAAPVASKAGPHPAAAAGPYAEQDAPAPAGQRMAGVESPKPAAHEKAQAAEREESPPTAQQAGRANDTQVLLVIRVLAGVREADAEAAEAFPAEPAAPAAATKEAAH